jgi:alkylation response protein AidB-like acyl-CoA dehydrogenase
MTFGEGRDHAALSRLVETTTSQIVIVYYDCFNAQSTRGEPEASCNAPVEKKAAMSISPYIDDPELCTELLARVASIAGVLAASTAESERLGHLAPTALEALRRTRLAEIRLATTLGGVEASIATQTMVLAALARVDSASAWCTMVALNGVGSLGAYFPAETVDEVFGKAERPLASVVAAPNGLAKEVAGGWRVSGRWRFCSGFHQAAWVLCIARVEGDESQHLLLAVPKADLVPHEVWDVAGLKGTGSIDFSMQDVFVPTRRAVNNNARKQLRGRRIYARPGVILAVYEHAGWALGAGRRAIDLLTAALAPADRTIVERELPCRELSQLTLRLDAAQDLTLQHFSEVERMTPEESSSPIVDARGRAVAAFVTEVAWDCVDATSRRAGSRGLYLPNPIEGLMRDMRAAQCHTLVGDGAYAVHGQAIARRSRESA